MTRIEDLAVPFAVCGILVAASWLPARTAPVPSESTEDLGGTLPVLYESTKLTASDGGVVDRFGSSIAMSGGVAAIGARHDGDNGRQSGSVYLFERVGGAWIERGKLLASDGGQFQQFGYALDLSGDTLVVGAPSTRVISPPQPFNPGAVYVYVRDGLSWVEQAKLVPSDGRHFDQFGLSVAVKGDVAVVGAPGHSDLSCSSGAAYVFVREGATWTEAAELQANDTACNARFGSSVALSAGRIVVGAPGARVGALGGSAYVFAPGASGWIQEAKLVASDAQIFAFLGESVAISHGTVVAGAPNHDLGRGSAYAFSRGEGGWSQEAKLMPDGLRPAERLGFFVGMARDVALAGAIFDDGVARGAGSAFLFRRGTDGWTEVAQFLASDGAEFANLGSSAAYAAGTLLVGAPQHREDGRLGAVYVFELPERPDVGGE